MDRYELIINSDERVMDEIIAGNIILQDDMDDSGIWVVKWDTEIPMPKGLAVGK